MADEEIDVQYAPDEDTQASMAPVDRPGFLQKLINLLLVITILIHPTQATLKYALQWIGQYVPAAANLAGQVPELNFTTADILILIIVPIWLIKCLFAGGISSIKSIPLAVWLLVVVGAVSLCPLLNSQVQIPTAGADGKPASVMEYLSYGKDLIQYVLYFMVAYVLIASSMQWEKTMKGLAYIFLIVVTVVVAYGVLEADATDADIVLSPDKLGVKTAEAGEAPAPAKTEALAAAPTAEPAPPAASLLPWTVKRVEHAMEVDSTFGFAMVDATPKEVGTKSNRNVLGAFLCLVLPLAYGLFLFHPNWFVKLWMLAVAIAGLTIVLSGGALIAICIAFTVMAAMCRRSTMFVTAAMIGVIILYLYPKLPRENQKVILDSLMLKKTVDQYGTLPAPTTGKAIPEEGQWQQKYTEWQAALNAISLNPLVGVGLGHYQKNINLYYDTDLDPLEDYYVIEKEPGVNYMEPDSNNHYLVLATEAGIPALLIFAWVIAHFIRQAAQTFTKQEPGFRQALAAGLVGSMVALAVGSIFTVMLVRGLALTLVVVLALIHGVSYTPRAVVIAPIPEGVDEPGDQEIASLLDE